MGFQTLGRTFSHNRFNAEKAFPSRKGGVQEIRLLVFSAAAAAQECGHGLTAVAQLGRSAVLGRCAVLVSSLGRSAFPQRCAVSLAEERRAVIDRAPSRADALQYFQPLTPVATLLRDSLLSGTRFGKLTINAQPACTTFPETP